MGDDWLDDVEDIGEGILAGDLESDDTKDEETTVDIFEIYDFDCEEEDYEE